MGFIDKVKGIFGKMAETAAAQPPPARNPPPPKPGNLPPNPPAAAFHAGGHTTSTGRVVLAHEQPQMQNLPATSTDGRRILAALSRPQESREEAQVQRLRKAPHSTNAQRQQLKRLVDDIRTVPGSRAPTGLNRQQRRALGLHKVQ